MALTLSYPAASPPLGVLAAIRLTGANVEMKQDAKLDKDDPPVLAFPSSEELKGATSILRYLARAAPAGAAQLYGSSPLETTQVDQWLDFCPSLVSGAGLEAACAAVNDYLALRSYLVGYALSLADVSVWGQLAASLQWGRLRKGSGLPHLARWYDLVAEAPALRAVAEAHGPQGRAQKAAAAKASASQDGELARAKGGGDTGSFDVGLKDAEEGKVVTRFPPEPSGYLHIGHAKAALLNQYFADMYKGRLLVRFDDTNPSKEKDEYVDNIIADIHKLGLKFEKITYTSDYFPQLFDCGERLIRVGHMYADDTPLEQMRDERLKGVESRCRGRSVEENLRLFKEMQEGSEEGLRNCMRIKLDMSAANGALRDPVAFRCNPSHHWRTGNAYECYPTYDFACPFVDALEGVTHALRTSEYKDREAQFYWILQLQQSVWPGLPSVHIWDYARLSFVHTVLSKRKLTWFVQNGIVDGWDDPRMPTVQGMLRRGLQLEALREFIISQGASKNVTFQEWDKIWTINKKVIDPICPRHTAVEEADAVPVALAGAPAPPEAVEVPRHAKHPPAGTKQQWRSDALWLDQADAAVLSEGEEVTLMGWGNAIVRRIQRDSDGKVTAIDADLHLEGDFKKTRLKLTWLARRAGGGGGEAPPRLALHHFGYLIAKRRIEEEDAFEDFVNRESRVVVPALGDVNMRSLQKGDVIQLERKGYYIVDVPYDPQQPEQPIALFNIPDGRCKPAGAVGASKSSSSLAPSDRA